MAVSGADRQRAYLGRQREASARQAEELLALRREVEALRERNAALEAALRRARQERQRVTRMPQQAEPKKKPAQRPRDLSQFLRSTPKRSERQ